MKPPPDPNDAPWEKLVRLAQTDVGPPVDGAALHRAVRAAARAPIPETGWIAEFSALVVSRRVLPTCLSVACICTCLATWEVWDVWQALPWAQLLASTTGGGP